MSLKIISREQWGALPPVHVTPLEHPILMVGFSYLLPTNIFDRDIVKQLQKSHINILRMDDIQSNFLIGRDGTIYEGRGWHAQPHPRLIDDQTPDGNFLDISFIGNLECESESHPAHQSLVALLEFGQRWLYIEKEFMAMGEINQRVEKKQPRNSNNKK